MVSAAITNARGPWYRTPDHGALYGVYDAAAAGDVLPALATAGAPFMSLFEERGDPVLDEVAPHIITLDRERPWARRALDTGWGAAWSIYLHGPTNLQLVRRQLRRLLTAELPDGRQVMFRFYDPRILAVYLPTCLPGELEAFFGPIEAFYAFREDANVVDVFTRSADGRLAVETRPGPVRRAEVRA